MGLQALRAIALTLKTTAWPQANKLRDAGPSYRALYQHFATLTKNPAASKGSVRQLCAKREFATNKPAPETSSELNSKPLGSSRHAPTSESNPGKEGTVPVPERPPDPPAVIATYLPWIRRLAASTPHLGRPPTASELLPLARSSWHRLQIRLKWLTIRSFRPYRTDDYSAFASLILVLNLVLLALGTTTFFAVVLFIFNKAGMEGRVARWLSEYMTGSTGVRVVFESAAVPRWRDGMIRFENVYVSRGDLTDRPQALMEVVTDSTQSTHVGVVKAAVDVVGSVPVTRNAMHFHLTIASIDVTLSLGRWLDGKGLVRSAVVKGVRGVVDRSHIEGSGHIDMEQRRKGRREAQVGDFWLDGVKVEDLLVTVYQPNDFRPYTCSIFNADVRRLRKQWLLLDLLSAEQVTGQIDNCLFSLHRPQSLSRSNALLPPGSVPTKSRAEDDRWETRFSRFRIDGVPIDHLKTPQDCGALAWITSGRVDLVADISLPSERDEVDLARMVREIVENIEKEVGGPERKAHRHQGVITERPELVRPALQAPAPAPAADAQKANAAQARQAEEDGIELEPWEAMMQQKVIIDMDIRFKDVKATLPMYTSDLSYVNNALVRPIVAFINANRTLVPVRARVELDVKEFEGSWTTFDVGLVETISEQVYAALAHHVSSQAAQSQRLSKVGVWGIQMTASAVLEALRSHLDAAS